MPSIKLLKRAEIELTEACEWYEKQQKGLSLRLRNEVKWALDIVAKKPLHYSTRYNTDLRFAPLKKSPYVIVFWFDEQLDTVFVTSIFHTSRKPDTFK